VNLCYTESEFEGTPKVSHEQEWMVWVHAKRYSAKRFIPLVPRAMAVTAVSAVTRRLRMSWRRFCEREAEH
jgi:hypothetical protein